MRFFCGLHQPSDARHFDACCISVNRLRPRRTMVVRDWMMDGGAFTEVSNHGGYRTDVAEHADQIRRWSKTGNLVAAVAQDWMCEDKALRATGLSIEDHQRLTIERYDHLVACDVGGVYVMPVLQGFTPDEYVRNLRDYGARIGNGAWVGVGSVCKRNGKPQEIEAVLLAVHRARPDLRLHGFGLKLTALSSGLVLKLLHSADSMAWSLNARKNGRNANDWRNARRWVDRIESLPVQWPLIV